MPTNNSKNPWMESRALSSWLKSLAKDTTSQGENKTFVSLIVWQYCAVPEELQGLVTLVIVKLKR